MTYRKQSTGLTYKAEETALEILNEFRVYEHWIQDDDIKCMYLDTLAKLREYINDLATTDLATTEVRK